MIFFVMRFNSFLALALTATLLTSCFKKESEVIPPKLEDDKVLGLIQKEIDDLTKDKKKMQERIDSVNASIEENALRPKMVEYSRRELFQYDSMMRKIEQQIDYFKIRKSLREKDVYDRIKKGLTSEGLEKEFVSAELDFKANLTKYPWRSLPEPPKKESKEKTEGHGEDPHGGDKKEEKSSGGHH